MGGFGRERQCETHSRPGRETISNRAAEFYLPNYLKGFSEDGYCGEGIGYWNYGFGNYLLLSETILRATGGKIDLLAGPKIRKIAEYGFSIEIAPGLAPAFADADPASAPERRMLKFLKRRLSLPAGIYSREKNDTLSGPLQSVLFTLFPNSADRVQASSESARGDPPALHTYFDQAGILIARPEYGGKGLLAAAFKAGKNAGNHSHNDTGSYTVAVGNDAVLLDPGAEVYSARTFSSRRYESKLINSYGHPVPVVAGKLQESGPQAAARVLAAELGGDIDVFTIDLAACYNVPALKSLVREFVFSRSGEGELLVRDTVEFGSPQSFETALVTLGSVKIVSDHGFLVSGKSGALSVEVEASGGAFRVRTEAIDEEARTPTKPTRIGIMSVSPVRSAVVNLRIRPWRDSYAGIILANNREEIPCALHGFSFSSSPSSLSKVRLPRISRFPSAP